MNFEGVFELLPGSFQKGDINFALIGGFALARAGYIRATKDIDFPVAKENNYQV